MKRAVSTGVLLTVLRGTGRSAQPPQPFPRPADSAKPPSSAPPPATRSPDTQGLKVLPPAALPAATQASGNPTEESLGMPIYPGARFIASYDAGRGQRYYLFGVNTEFTQIVGYYRTALKQRGELVFEAPPIHMFDVGRFREETMAFPPGVTVKDYFPDGYLHPKQGTTPERFRTIIQIVPAPPVTAPIK